MYLLQGIRIGTGGIKRDGRGNDGYNEFVQVLCYGLQVGGFLKKNLLIRKSPVECLC